MDSSLPTVLLTTTMPCYSHPALIPVDGGIVLATTDAPISHHIVAIAIGVGVPGGLLLLTILVFIVFIFLSVQRLKRKRLFDEEAAEEIKSISRNTILDPILGRSRPTSNVPPRSPFTRSLSTGSIPTNASKYFISPSPQPPSYRSFDISRSDSHAYPPNEDLEISSTMTSAGYESPPQYI